MYFELGNEPNLNLGEDDVNQFNWLTFREWFSFGSQALQALLNEVVYNSYTPYYVPGHPKYSNYHFLTGGIIQPEPYEGCTSAEFGDSTQALQNALHDAQMNYRTNPDPTYPFAVPGVPLAHLGVASHPYSYLPTQYPDILTVNPGITFNRCADLNMLIGDWNYNYFPGVLHIATEANYSSQPSGPDGSTQQVANSEGAYLMDVFTYMYNNLGADGQWGYSGGEAAYPFRLMWFNGYDSPSPHQGQPGQTLGLLLRSPEGCGNNCYSSDKYINFSPYCSISTGMLFNGDSLTHIMDVLRKEGGSPGGGAHCF